MHYSIIILMIKHCVRLGHAEKVIYTDFIMYASVHGYLQY